MNSDTPDSVPAEAFTARRNAVFERLGDGVMMLPAAPVQHASRDTERPYAADRELYYLTGLVEPETVALLIGGAEPRLELFVRERDAAAELWTGPRIGPEGALERTGAAACHPLQELDARLPELLGGADRIHYRLGRRGGVEDFVYRALAQARARGQRVGNGPRGVADPGEILDDLRLVKDEHELALIRHACGITTHGHRAGAASIGVGVGEWAVEAAVEGAFRAAGATGPGFDTIVGSGLNGCVLHYVENRALVPEDGLVLIDAGAEYGLYHGDVTRTYPAAGVFTPEQRVIYELVDEARRAGIDASGPGVTIASVHEASTRVLVEGLVHLGVLEGEVDGLIETRAHQVFYPHQTSHWLGLDVHDPGDYARDGTPRLLEPGMVFTVEPGLYFRPEQTTGASEVFAGIGVRIEDDVVITAAGCDVLTAGIPTGVAEVEELVGK